MSIYGPCLIPTTVLLCSHPCTHSLLCASLDTGKHVNTCVHVCAFMCMCLHVCVCVHMCTCMCVHVYVYVCTHVYVYVCTCVRVCVHMFTCMCAHVYVYVCTCVRVCVHTCVRVCVHMCMCMCMCTRVCVCTCVCMCRVQAHTCSVILWGLASSPVRTGSRVVWGRGKGLVSIVLDFHETLINWHCFILGHSLCLYNNMLTRHNVLQAIVHVCTCPT